jgi:hypothetical protein
VVRHCRRAQLLQQPVPVLVAALLAAPLAGPARHQRLQQGLHHFAAPPEEHRVLQGQRRAVPDQQQQRADPKARLGVQGGGPSRAPRRPRRGPAVD